MSRREIYTDAREISQTVDGVLMPEATYLEQLAQKGNTALSENIETKLFDAQVDSKLYSYGEDYNLGDLVQVVSNYGIESKARVNEIIYSESVSSVDLYPTFTIID
jgi:hypothetical protein